MVDARLRETRRRLPAPSGRAVASMAGADARARWEAASPHQKRNVARALLTRVTLLPVTGGRRNVFNPAFLAYEWRTAS